MAESKYHISPTTGRANKCYAQAGNCPLKSEDGGEPKHYASKEEARAGYEVDNKDKVFVSVKKNTVATGNTTENKENSEPFKLDEENAKIYSSYKNLYNKKDQATVEKLIEGKTVSDKELDNFIEDNRQHLITDNESVNDRDNKTLYNTVAELRKTRKTPSTLTTSENFDPSVSSVFSNPAARKNPSIAVKSIVKELHHSNYMRERNGEYIDQLLDKNGIYDKTSASTNKDYFADEVKRSDARLKAMVKEVEWLKANSPGYSAAITSSHRTGLAMINTDVDDAPIGIIKKAK